MIAGIFITTFKRKHFEKGIDEGVYKGVSGGVNHLFNYIKNNPGKRVPHFEKALHIPSKTIERWLKKLKNEGKISQ